MAAAGPLAPAAPPAQAEPPAPPMAAEAPARKAGPAARRALDNYEKEPLRPYIEALTTVKDQDLERDDAGKVVIRQGVALDGVYVENEQGDLRFHTLGTPSSDEVRDIARRTAVRLHRAFQKKRRPSPWDDEHAFVDSGESDPFSLEQPGLFACYQAAASGVAVSAQSARQPLLRLLVQTPSEPERPTDDQRAAEPVAEALGVNLYAKQLVDGRDRRQLERLCRYVMRPPLSQERLEWRSDGRLELTLKNVWKDGTRALVLQPFELLVRLCSAIPPPWFNMIRYFGVLSSHSRHRARVVPKRLDPSRFRSPEAAGDQLELGFGSGDATTAAQTSGRSRWGWLLRHVFIWRMQCSTYNQVVTSGHPGACHAPIPPMARTRARGASKRYPLRRGPGLLPLATRARLLAANGLDQPDRASRLRA